MCVHVCVYTCECVRACVCGCVRVWKQNKTDKTKQTGTTRSGMQKLPFINGIKNNKIISFLTISVSSPLEYLFCRHPF